VRFSQQVPPWLNSEWMKLENKFTFDKETNKSIWEFLNKQLNVLIGKCAWHGIKTWEI